MECFNSGFNTYSEDFDDPQRNQLASKYGAKLQALTEDHQFLKVINNKAIAALFLDRMSRGHLTDGEKETLAKYGYSSSAINSMQMIHYLESVKYDPRLKPTTRQAIEKWIQSEKEYLQIAIIFDGWRAENPEVMKLLKGGSPVVPDLMSKIAIRAPQEEVEKLAESIAMQLQDLKPGETFKMLGGYNVHETRLQIRRNEDLSFTIHHYNTASHRSRIVKYGPIPSQSLDTTFWKQFINLKLQETDMFAMDRLLAKISSNNSAGEQAAEKSKQQGNSCAGQAVDASLKHEVVVSASTPQEGEQEYKLLKSMMVAQAVKGEDLDPIVLSLLQSKARVKSRYFQWHAMQKDPNKMQEIRDLYVQLIAVIDPKIMQETPLPLSRVSLHALDQKLHLVMMEATKEQFAQIFDMHQRLYPGTTPIMCLKFHERARQVQKVIPDVLYQAKSLSNTVKGILRPFLPESLQSLAAPPQIEKKTIIDLVRTENAEKARSIIEELLNRGALNLDEFRGEVFNHAHDKAFLNIFVPIFYKKLHPQDPLMPYLKGLFSAPAEIPKEERFEVLLRLQGGDLKEKILECIETFINENTSLEETIKELNLRHFSEPLGIAVKNRNLKGDIPREEILAALQYLSAKDQIEILNTFSEPNLDFLAEKNVSLHAQTVRYFYKRKQLLTSESAGALFLLSLETTPVKEWARDLPLYLNEGIISFESIHRLLLNLSKQNEVAAGMLAYQDLPDSSRLYVLHFFPKKYLAAVQETPSLLDHFNSEDLEKFTTNELWGLAHTASLSHHPACLSAVLDRLAQDKTQQAALQAFLLRDENVI